MQVSVQVLHFAQDCRFYSHVLQTADNVSLVSGSEQTAARDSCGWEGLDVEHGLALHPAAIQCNMKKNRVGPALWWR